MEEIEISLGGLTDRPALRRATRVLKDAGVSQKAADLAAWLLVRRQRPIKAGGKLVTPQ